VWAVLSAHNKSIITHFFSFVKGFSRNCFAFFLVFSLYRLFLAAHIVENGFLLAEGLKVVIFGIIPALRLVIWIYYIFLYHGIAVEHDNKPCKGQRPYGEQYYAYRGHIEHYNGDKRNKCQTEQCKQILFQSETARKNEFLIIFFRLRSMAAIMGNI